MAEPAFALEATGAQDFSELTMEAVNRRGQAFRCKVTVSQMRNRADGNGAILLMEVAED